MTRIKPISHERGEQEIAQRQAERQGVVSFRVDIPEPLREAMVTFLEGHPNWDQYRLIQASLAGFLVQNGVQDRGVTRCFLANLFPASGRFAPLDPSGPGPQVRPAALQPRSQRQPFHAAS